MCHEAWTLVIWAPTWNILTWQEIWLQLRVAFPKQKRLFPSEVACACKIWPAQITESTWRSCWVDAVCAWRVRVWGVQVGILPQSTPTFPNQHLAFRVGVMSLSSTLPVWMGKKITDTWIKKKIIVQCKECYLVIVNCCRKTCGTSGKHSRI